jgi:cold shock CspA family protein
VRHFDERRGLGEVTTDEGRVFAFHATAIADGTRKIPEGMTVEFDLVAGLPGRWEATAIERHD